MSELPLVSRRGKAVDPSVLELLGKKAALAFIENKIPLNDSITKMASGSDLSPEHIRRVSEFANKATHNQIFATTKDRAFSFPLADAGEIMREMNDGSANVIAAPGEQAVKIAMARVLPKQNYFPGADSISFEEMFGVSIEKTASYESSRPKGRLEDLHSTLISASEHITAQKMGVDALLMDARTDLYHEVKQASLYGLTFRDIYGAMNFVATRPDILKVACAQAIVGLREDVSFVRNDQTVKTASGVLNQEHPLLDAYRLYEDLTIKSRVLEKAASRLAEKRASVEETLRGTVQHA